MKNALTTVLAAFAMLLGHFLFAEETRQPHQHHGEMHYPEASVQTVEVVREVEVEVPGPERVVERTVEVPAELNPRAGFGVDLNTDVSQIPGGSLFFDLEHDPLEVHFRLGFGPNRADEFATSVDIAVLYDFGDWVVEGGFDRHSISNDNDPVEGGNGDTCANPVCTGSIDTYHGSFSYGWEVEDFSGGELHFRLGPAIAQNDAAVRAALTWERGAFEVEADLLGVGSDVEGDVVSTGRLSYREGKLGYYVGYRYGLPNDGSSWNNGRQPADPPQWGILSGIEMEF